MRFLADLHVHSYLSRATSKDLNLEALHRVAQRKGITLVGTGDFTHPRWLAELRDKLVPAGDGLFALRDDLARAVDATVPPACRAPVRFLLSVEVSSIYKHDGKVRKVHNLVYAPDFEAAAKVATRLAHIGNIESDGRPILGLDSRDLLEIVLESSADAFVVPAHIWTPWFSALGAQSGFDGIAECFRDLADHIFAVETGLSSDPAMNFRLSSLDRYALVSNSDAHSPDKLGREATVFDCDLSYFALRDALRDRRDGLAGTVEFFPEEGKYHFDGHRACGVVLSPQEARDARGVCPVCSKRLTSGVLGRVEALADRPEGVRPEGAKPFQSFVPLAEVVSELVDAGVGSTRVSRVCEQLLDRIGPELSILGDVPLDALGRGGPPLLDEAIRRMRGGDVQIRPGYDGEYGVVRMFDDDERRRLFAQQSFAFATKAIAAPEPSEPPEPELSELELELEPPAEPPAVSAPALDAEQARVVEHVAGPLLVLAGPGTGKTRVIAHRIARLVRTGTVSARAITAITFTRRAAAELGERIRSLLGAAADPIQITTFHALGLGLLREFSEQAGLAPDFIVLDEEERSAAIEAAISTADAETASERTPGKAAGTRSLGKIAAAIGWAKAHLTEPDCVAPELRPIFIAYQRQLEARAALDFDDLVARAVRLLAACPEARAAVEERCRYLFVDEYQDINAAQEELLRWLAPPSAETNLCAVGDPDQAIYGFRGSDPSYIARFSERYPASVTIALRVNYRCPATVVRAATRVIERSPGRASRPLEPFAECSTPIERFCFSSEAEEAEFIAREIERAVGGTSLYSLDAGRADAALDSPLSFHEVAVLFRLSALGEALGKALDHAGIPYQRVGDDALHARPRMPELVARLRALVDGGSFADGHREDAELAAEIGRSEIADLVLRLADRKVDPELCAAAELLATLAVPFGRDGNAFLTELPLLREADRALEPQKVALLTLHAAKGLEFPLVFVTGCEDGVLPCRLPGRLAEDVDVEEERRLLYVGMTRARRRLVLTSARRRTLYGRAAENAESPFLEGLPAELVAPSEVIRRPRVARQLSLPGT